MTAEGTINYEALAQEAMRGVVRSVLTRTAKSGLPGEHHFYVSFDTQMPGVFLSRRLKEKYPEEMTIVLQHRFWDLSVTDDRFEVKLTFDGIPERLVVPFSAIKVFFDPSVRYGLQFDEIDFGPDSAPTSDSATHTIGDVAGGAGDRAPASGRPSSAPARKRPPRKARTERSDAAGDPPSDVVGGPGPVDTSGEASPPGRRTVPMKPAVVDRDTAASVKGPQPVTGGAGAGAQIVSLSDFRKK